MNLEMTAPLQELLIYNLSYVYNIWMTFQHLQGRSLLQIKAV